MYGEKDIVKYSQNKNHSAIEPHIFDVSNRAYYSMLESNENQSILITGESGAGKTENTKKVIRYLTSIANTFFLKNFVDNDHALLKEPMHTFKFVSKENEFMMRKIAEELENKILSANPILEAFGNAQTVRNNNSSRFGKFVKLEFDANGYILGAHIDKYLFEKSRVTHQNPKERNFHVFYQLLKGADDQLKRM